MFSKKDDEKSKTLAELAIYLNCTEEMLTNTDKLTDEVLINFRSKLFKIPTGQIDSFVETLSPTQQQHYLILKARFEQLDNIDKVKAAKDDTPTTPPPATGGGLFAAAYSLVSNGVSYVTGGSPPKPTVAPNEDWVHVGQDQDKETKKPDDFTPGAPVEKIDEEEKRKAQEALERQQQEELRVREEQRVRELEEQRVRDEQRVREEQRIAAEQQARELEKQRKEENKVRTQQFCGAAFNKLSQKHKTALEETFAINGNIDGAPEAKQALAKVKEENKVRTQQFCGAAFNELSQKHKTALEETFAINGNIDGAPEAKQALAKVEQEQRLAKVEKERIEAASKLAQFERTLSSKLPHGSWMLTQFTLQEKQTLSRALGPNLNWVAECPGTLKQKLFRLVER